MAYNKQKLLRFKENLIKSVDFKIMEIKNEVEAYEKTELKTFENKLLNEIFVSMQNKAKIIKSSFKQRLSKETLNLKNEIVAFRNNLLNNFKEFCKTELERFAQTQAYENYLIESMKISCKNLEPNEAELKIRRIDLKFKSKILTIENFSSIEADDSIEIGGFKIILKKQKILIDKTLTSLLEKEFENFKKNSELAVNLSDEE